MKGIEEVFKRWGNHSSRCCYIIACIFFAWLSPSSASSFHLGGKANSANYSDEATLGDIIGTSTAAHVTLKSGFIGQLYETQSLAVTAAPPAVVESGTTQMSAVATMDDDTLVRLGGSEVKWSVLDGPLAGISLSGLATASEVFIHAPATVRGRWDEIAGDLTLTVLNANVASPNGVVSVKFRTFYFQRR